jgi:hypothetical protein
VFFYDIFRVRGGDMGDVKNPLKVKLKLLEYHFLGI